MKKSVLLLGLILCYGARAQSLIPFQAKDKFGYMKIDGSIQLAAIYDYAAPFHEGYAMTAFMHYPCLIDEKGNRVIDTGAFQFIGTFSEGLVPVMDYKFRRKYYSANGKLILTTDRDIYDAHSFYNGLALVSKKADEVAKKFGQDIHTLGYSHAYLKHDGTYASEFIFDDAEDFYEGMARVKQNGKFGLIDTNMKFIVACNYESIGMFFDGLALVSLHNKFGFIDKNGKEVIAPQFEFAADFSEGFAMFQREGKSGFINKEGKIVIDAQYAQVKPFGQGLAGVSDGKKWGFIDNKGNQRMNYVYDDVGYFNKDVCPVRLKNKWGAIDLNGRLIVPLDFEYISIFDDNGLADALFHDISFTINSRGKRIPE